MMALRVLAQLGAGEAEEVATRILNLGRDWIATLAGRTVKVGVADRIVLIAALTPLAGDVVIRCETDLMLAVRFQLPWRHDELETVGGQRRIERLDDDRLGRRQ